MFEHLGEGRNITFCNHCMKFVNYDMQDVKEKPNGYWEGQSSYYVVCPECGKKLEVAPF